MDTMKPIDWPARHARATEWLELWRAERDKAQRERRPMRWIDYEYEPAAPAAAAPAPRVAQEEDDAT